jgi:hypothetical protein
MSNGQIIYFKTLIYIFLFLEANFPCQALILLCFVLFCSTLLYSIVFYLLFLDLVAQNTLRYW